MILGKLANKSQHCWTELRGVGVETNISQLTDGFREGVCLLWNGKCLLIKTVNTEPCPDASLSPQTDAL